MSASIQEVTRERCYVIAELGQNAGGDPAEMRRLIDAAAWCGVQAVKGAKRNLDALFTHEELCRPYSSPHAFGTTYGAHRAALEFSIDQHAEFARYAAAKGIAYSLSVWDEVSLREAVDAGMPWIKVPSACATALPLIRKIGATGLPVILSTGMTSQEQCDEAVNELGAVGVHWLSVLQCSSSYPTEFADVHLRVLADWVARDAFAADAYGCSLHTRGIAIDVAAVALGARVLERHVTLDRSAKGTDHAASLEPDGLRKLVRDVRACEAALGSSYKRMLESERPVAQKLRGAKLRGAA